ncbi:MAG: hypothetical protein L6R36_000254 [Xanthoria steineri]|nr:MAG: hypothetical protein L6R36_000254 [Xanthoria steineri]
MSTTKLVEGVFAVNKPKFISSAQVLRDLQHSFNRSALFAPWLESEKARRVEESKRQRQRRRDKRIQVKLGHGGTLDPMATGVLIVGVGKGTKLLQDFLTCTKTYEATVLFGAATDTYDVLGKVLSKAPYTHLTRENVESALNKFRGPINQKPPLYSALRMDGKRLYEYAREGKEIPREIQERPVTTESLELRQWLPGGCHPYTWPDEEADEEEKLVADKVLHLDAAADKEKDNLPSTHNALGADLTQGTKRRREVDEEDDAEIGITPACKRREISPTPTMSGARHDSGSSDGVTAPAARIQTPAEPQTSPEKLPSRTEPPAARLSMTVTSGFYVRSLCHDLGQDVGSLGIMSELVRTRQAGFELGRNVLEYDDLCKAEDVWAPLLVQMLDDWREKMAGEEEDAPDRDEILESS